MANESSPLLGDLNGAASHANGKHDAQGYSSYHTASTTSPRFYLGYDKSALFGTPPSGLSSVEAARRLKTFGANEHKQGETSAIARLSLAFVRPKALLLWVAMLLELVQLEFVNATALLFLQLVSSSVAWLHHTRVQRALSTIDSQRRTDAIVVRDGVHQTIDTSLLVPGDRLTLSAGMTVPADCQLCVGAAVAVDQASLIGESLGVALYPNDTARYGSTVVKGEGDAIVVATRDQTFWARHNLHHDSDTISSLSTVERAAMRLTLGLVFLVVVSALFCLNDLRLDDRSRMLCFVSYSLVITVVVAPLSSPAVCKLVLALGARRLLDDKVLVKNLEGVQQLAAMDMLCCDKTGTLTRNKLELQDDLPIFDPRGSREDVLVAAALAAKWKEPPCDAVDTLVLNAIDLRPLDQYVLLQHAPFDPVAKRTESVVRGPTGRVFKVSKGSPESILALVRHDTDIRESVEAKVMDLARRGVSSLAVARADEEEGSGWVLLGMITYVDPPRHDSNRMLEFAHASGVAVKLVTGEQAAIAVEACRQLGLGMSVLDMPSVPTEELRRIVQTADGFAHALPAQKQRAVEVLGQHGWCCGVTGSRVADMAAMKSARVSIAVDGACDAVREAADVALAKPGLAVIMGGVLSARQTLVRAASYLKLQLFATTHLTLCVVMAALLLRLDTCEFPHFAARGSHCTDANGEELEATEPSPSPFFLLPVIALVMLGLVRDLTSAVVLHDTISPAQQQPISWHMGRVLVQGVSSGVVAASSSLVLLYWCLDSWRSTNLLASFGLGALSMPQVRSVAWLQWALTTIASLAVARDASSQGVLANRPSAVVWGAALTSAALATSVALFSPFPSLAPLGLKLAAFVWAYSVLAACVLFAVDVAVARGLLELQRLGVVAGSAASERFAGHERQRRNRLHLGLSFWGDECTVHDSFVVGRPVASVVKP